MDYYHYSCALEERKSALGRTKKGAFIHARPIDQVIAPSRAAQQHSGARLNGLQGHRANAVKAPTGALTGDHRALHARWSGATYPTPSSYARAANPQPEKARRLYKAHLHPKRSAISPLPYPTAVWRYVRSLPSRLQSCN